MNMKNPKNYFSIVILIVFLAFFVFTGCTAKEKISKDEAIRIALNDTKTIQAINKSNFNVSEVSTANLGIGTESTNEVYYISIKVLDRSNRQVNIFVTYEGKVVLVDIPYPMITPPDYLMNSSYPPISGQNFTGRNLTHESTPLEKPKNYR